jgi:LysR family transcriptional regulator, cys regulon transcriptional activator
MNVSNAAKTRHTSQPGMSHQIRALEEELQVDLFVRDKSRLVSLTATGELVLGYIESILANVDSIRQIAQSATRKADEDFTIVTTHTQARYVLPDVLRAFAASQPGIRLSVRHCGIEEVLPTLTREADIAVVPVATAPPANVVIVECKRYARIVIVPAGHPLEGHHDVTLESLAAEPLVMYEQSVPTRSQLLSIFQSRGLEPKVVLNVINSDVMKACVENGMGIAVVPEFVYSPERDTRLRALRVGHLFPPAFTLLALRRNRPLTPAVMKVAQLLAPALTAEVLRALMSH